MAALLTTSFLLAIALGAQVPSISLAASEGETRASVDALLEGDSNEASVEIEARLDIGAGRGGGSEPVAVSADLMAKIPTLPTDAHIALVFDTSGSMAGTPSVEAKQAGKDLVDQLDLWDHPDTLAGVVGFNSTARTYCRLTNEIGRLKSCINKLGASGGTAINKGIQEGLQLLRLERNQLPIGFNEMMVVLSDGANNEGCPPVVQAADIAKAEGVRIFTICAGPGCDRACLRSVASPGDDYLVLEFAALGEVFRDIGVSMNAMPGIAALELSLTAPSGSAFAPESARPSPDRVDGNEAYWTIERPHRDGVALRIETLAGPRPSGEFTLDVAAITLEGQRVEQSFADALETPTPLPSATPAPTEMPTAEPTRRIPEPAPSWGELFLPRLSLFAGGG